jgi:hypothetical protein
LGDPDLVCPERVCFVPVWWKSACLCPWRIPGCFILVRRAHVFGCLAASNSFQSVSKGPPISWFAGWGFPDPH